MIKVLHVLAAMNDGGVEQMIMNYFSVMDREIVQFDFIVHSKRAGMLEQAAESMGAHIYHVPPKTQNVYLYVKEMKRIMLEGQYDIIHCHQGNKSMYPLLIAKMACIPKRIAHAHSAIPADTLFDKIIKRLETHFTAKYATLLLACSQNSGDNVWKGKEYQVLRDAVDIRKYEFSGEKRKSLRKELGIENKSVVICVARMVSSKNHKRLLEIIAKMQQEDANIALLLVGSGGLEENIREMVNSLQIKDVIFAGSRANVGDYLSASDIFVLPTLHEGFGMAFLEAQINGLEIVTTDVVSQEVRLSDKLHVLPLSATVDDWISTIYRYLNSERKQEFVREACEYDIELQEKRLMDIYCPNI